MLTRKQELEAALDPARRYYGWLKALEAAARKQLALMPEKCDHCDGTGSTFDDPACYACTCPICHGSGKVYPPETVEKIVEALGLLRGSTRTLAVAVLDALGET